MTTSAVSQINMFAAGQSAAGNVKNTQTDSFSQIFASQADAKAEAKAQEPRTEEVKATDKGISDEKVNEPERVTDSQEANDVSEEETKVENAEKTQEALSKEEVEKATEELMTKIQEVLNVSRQDIQNALEALGITASELLNTENIPALVVALTAGADELSVMTNEGLFANVQEITAAAEGLLEGLAKETGMSLEDIQAALAKLSEMQADEPAVYTNANPSNAVSPEEIAVSMENTGLENMQAVKEGQMEDSRQSASDDMSGNANEQQMTFAQTVAERLEQAVAKTESVTTSYTTTTESVMNQIQDAIRVIQTQDMTEMELQLHPASLGNLRIQIAAKEGVITAVFTTENETVRAALEAQMVTLKENFEQQGVKVEAVEVTVASHAFEQNLNGNESRTGEQETQEKKRGSRRITLDDLTMDNLEETLSDEDRIVAEMMKENGNTVDYTV